MLIFALLLLGYLNASFGHLDVHFGNTEILQITAGVLRGAAEMGIGLFAAEISEHIEHKTWHWTIVGFLVLMLMLICIVKYPHTQLDFTFMLLAAIFISLEFCDVFLLERFCYLPRSIGMLSRNIYFCHTLMISLWAYFINAFNSITNGSEWLVMIIFIFTVCLCSIALEACVFGLKFCANKLSAK